MLQQKSRLIQVNVFTIFYCPVMVQTELFFFIFWATAAEDQTLLSVTHSSHRLRGEKSVQILPLGVQQLVTGAEPLKGHLCTFFFYHKKVHSSTLNLLCNSFSLFLAKKHLVLSKIYVLINVYLLCSSNKIFLWLYNMPLKIYTSKGF